MRQGEHDRHVRPGHRGVPVARAVDVVAQRGERHDLAAAFPKPAQCIPGRVGGRAAVVDTGVLQCHPAETHHQVGVFDDDVPLGGPFEQVVVGAHHPGHDDPGRAQAVGVTRECVPAKAVQESMYLALSVVEAAGAGPTVRTAVDRLVTVGVHHAAQFIGQQVGEFVPGHRDELVGAASIAGARSALEPAAADRRRGDPRSVPDGAGNVAQRRRGIGVAGQRCHRRDVTGIDGRGERAPMRQAGQSGWDGRDHGGEFMTVG